MAMLYNPLKSQKNVLLIAALLLFYSLLRGVRYPNIWSYTHYLLNYDQGFSKRSLIGSIVNAIPIDYLSSYSFFVIFSYSVLALCLALLFRLIKKASNKNDLYINISILLFCSSFAVVYLAHLVGYFDQIGLLATLIILNIRSFKNKIIFAFPASLICLFIHEAALFFYFPIIFISLLNAIYCENGTYQKYPIFILLIFSACFLLTTHSLSQSNISKDQALTAYQATQAKSTIKLRQDAFIVQSRTGFENIAVMQKLWKSPNRVHNLIISSAFTLPISLFFSVILFIYLRQLKINLLVIFLSLLAPYSVLLLHYIATDTNRFNTLTITTSFLSLLLYANAYQETIKTTKIKTFSLSIIFILLLTLGLIGYISLHNKYYMKSFPFSEHQQYIKDLIEGREKFPFIPAR